MADFSRTYFSPAETARWDNSRDFSLAEEPKASMVEAKAVLPKSEERSKNMLWRESFQQKEIEAGIPERYLWPCKMTSVKHP